MTPVTAILHPTDFSPHSERALDLAVRLARQYQAKLVVLHVFPPPAAVTFGGGVAAAPVAADTAQQDAWDELNGLLILDEGLDLDRRLMAGNVVDEILRVVKDTPCQLIVMGTHGRSGISRLLMGSVAEQVVRNAPCSVLTVRLPSDDPSAASTGEAVREGLGVPHT